MVIANRINNDNSSSHHTELRSDIADCYPQLSPLLAAGYYDARANRRVPRKLRVFGSKKPAGFFAIGIRKSQQAAGYSTLRFSNN